MGEKMEKHLPEVYLRWYIPRALNAKIHAVVVG